MQPQMASKILQEDPNAPLLENHEVSLIESLGIESSQSENKHRKNRSKTQILKNQDCCCSCCLHWKLIAAGFFESLDSTLGIFMASAVFFETAYGGTKAIQIHSLDWSIGIAGFFGLFIWLYTYKLLEIKHREETSKDNSKVQKLTITCWINIFLILTTIAAGLDAGAALFQQMATDWNSSRVVALIFLWLGILSFVCRAAKYYIADLGTQLDDPSRLAGVGRYTNDKFFARRILRPAVFQLFPFGEAIAHLLAAYILYADFIKPYLLINHAFPYVHEISFSLMGIGIAIGALGFFAQYVIICATDLNWAAQTLDKKREKTSAKIDNRFGLIGQILLYGTIFIYKRLFCCKQPGKAFKYLQRQIKWSKILGQGIFVGAGFLLLASIVWTGFSTTQVAGSITSVTIGNTTFPAWVVAISIFTVGYLGGMFLGFRQWKAKNANHEVDRFIVSFLANFNLKCINPQRSAKKPSPLWIEMKQDDAQSTWVNNIKEHYTHIFAFLGLGAIMGAGYGAENLHTSVEKLLTNGKFYSYVAWGGITFMFIATVIIAIGRRDLLAKQSSQTGIVANIPNDDENNPQCNDTKNSLLQQAMQ